LDGQLKEKKNICITITSIGMGGAEKQCLLLASALKTAHNIHLIIIDHNPIHPPYLKIIEREGLDHMFLSANPLKRIVDLIRFLRNKNIDVIFSFLPKDTTLSAICGKVAGVPYIFGGIRNSYLPKIKFVVLRFIHNLLLSYTIANNYSAYQAAIEFGFREKVFVIHNGINIRPILQKPDQEKKTLRIISVGRFVKQKDYETALKSIRRLKQILDKNQRFKYCIVGSGPERKTIIENIEKFGLENEVEIISDPPVIYDLLEEADIYLCTSTFEGISNAIMEAMNCELPIVATDAGDNSHLVIHEKNGFITDINDHLKIAENLCVLMENPKIRNLMGQESHNHLAQHFGYDSFRKKYLDVIDHLDDIQLYKGNFRVKASRPII